MNSSPILTVLFSLFWSPLLFWGNNPCFYAVKCSTVFTRQLLPFSAVCFWAGGDKGHELSEKKSSFHTTTLNLTWRSWKCERKCPNQLNKTLNSLYPDSFLLHKSRQCPTQKRLKPAETRQNVNMTQWRLDYVNKHISVPHQLSTENSHTDRTCTVQPRIRFDQVLFHCKQLQTRLMGEVTFSAIPVMLLLNVSQ